LRDGDGITVKSIMKATKKSSISRPEFRSGELRGGGRSGHEEKVVKANQLIDEHIASAIEKGGRESLKIRSGIDLRCGRGVCAQCYGRNLATGQFVKLGEAVVSLPRNQSASPARS